MELPAVKCNQVRYSMNLGRRMIPVGAGQHFQKFPKTELYSKRRIDKGSKCEFKGYKDCENGLKMVKEMILSGNNELAEMMLKKLKDMK